MTKQELLKENSLLRQRIKELEHLESTHKQVEEQSLQSEEKFAQIFMMSPNGISITRLRDGLIIDTNIGFREVSGWKRDEVIGRTSLEVNFWDDPADRTFLVEELKAGRDVIQREFQFRRKDGTQRLGIYSARLIRIAGEECIIFVMQDITERKMIEKQLQESEQMFRSIVENSYAGIYMSDNFKLSYVNDKLCELSGYTREELLGMDISGLIAEESLPLVADRYMRRQKGEDVPSWYEVSGIRKDGEKRFMETSAAVLPDISGRVITVGQILDINPRKQAEKALRESEERFKSFVSTSQDWIWAIDFEFRHTFSNDAIKNILGYCPDEVVGQDLLHLIHEEDIANVTETLARCKTQIIGWKNLILRWRHRDGSYRYLESNAVPILDAMGNLQGFQGNDRDITDWMQAEATLLESEEKFSRVFRMSPDIITISRVSDGKYIDVNDEYVRVMGYSREETIGRTAFDLDVWVDPADRERMLESFRTKKEILPTAYCFRSKEGKIITAEMSARVITIGGEKCLLSMFRDISEKIEAQKAQRESQERFRSVVEKSLVGIAIIDDTFRYVYVNEEFCRIAGYSEQEMMGRNFTFPLTEESASIAAERTMRRQRGEDVPSHYEFSFRQKNGSERIGEVRSASYLDSMGRARTIIQIIDTSQRKQAEEALKKSEAYFRAITENASDILVISDKDGNITYTSPSVERVAGYHPEEMIGVNFFTLIVPEDAPRVAEDFARALQTQDTNIPNSFRVRHKNGKELVLDGMGVNLLNDPVLKGFVMSARDITERKRIEVSLLEKERLLNLITENMSDMIRITDLQGRNLYSSPSHFKGLGYRQEERVGKSSFDLVHPDDLERMTNEFVEGFFTNQRVTTEYRVKHEDGHYVWLETVADILRDDHSEATAMIMSSRDISERKHAEERLQEYQRRLSDIIEFLPDATLVIDSEGKVIAWNRAIEAMTRVKKEEMLGKGNYEYSIPFYGERRRILIDLALHPDLEKEREYVTIKRIGDVVWGDAHTPMLPPGNVHLSGTASVLRDQEGKIVGAIECIRDYTERKNMEERLQRAEKMEALGILAGGVAHDLNNVLGVLVGYSELLLRDVQEGSRAEKFAKSILDGGGRAAAIIQDLLTMARRGVSVSETVNLNQIVADTFKRPEFELMKAHHPDVRFQFQMEKDLFNIKGSPVHLSKSILNLLSNAAEAIQREGTVTITTENRYVDVAIPGYESTQEGEYVVLTVTDTGSGIASEDIGRLFEPFYTKKVMGRSGTGLGLPVVWGTVKDHNGYIDVRTELTKGTSFVLYFPVTREALSKTDQALAESEYRGKGESILVVDDVEEQRLLAATILEGLNYRVALAASGEEAVEYLRTNKADLIILDMIMDPGIDGLETYRRIHEIRPQQKAIIVSGYAKTERVGKAQQLGAGEYVKKPYVIEKLGMAVRNELGKTAAG